MMFGKFFRRGACRCGSASDAAPLRAEGMAHKPGTNLAPDPAFGTLPEPLAAWRRFREGPVEVVYTTDPAHADHALTGGRASPPAGPQRCAVDRIDLGTIADPAHPALVQVIARMAAHALKVFRDLGFRTPASLTIHLCTFGKDKGRDRAYRGGTEVWLPHVWVSIHLDGADALLTVAHEVFHRVQYEYNRTTAKTSPLYAALREGGARLAEDWVLDSGDRYLKDGLEFLGDPGRPLLHYAAPSGDIAPHSYASALFWRWLCEQHGEIGHDAGQGHGVMRTILERMIDDSGYILQDLREARGLVVGEGHLDRFEHLDVTGGEILSTETDWGNFLVANWLHGTGQPTPDQRFDYVEDDEGGGRFSQERPFVWPDETLAASALAVRPYAFTIPGDAARCAFSARYTVVKIDAGAPPLLRIDFAVQAGMRDPLVQIMLIGRDVPGQGVLRDLIRLDGTAWTRCVPTAGLEQVVVIVAAREESGRYRLGIEAASGRAVLHAAPWNAAPGTSFETDPRDPKTRWGWTSPDLALTGQEVCLRVTNRGDAASDPLQVAIAAQGTTADVPLRAAQWQKVGEATLPALAPGATGEVRIPWRQPRTPAAATGWGLRATVTGGPDGRMVVLSSAGTLARPARIDAVL
jgi:hypothetical protein